jgi:hypothetical protein
MSKGRRNLLTGRLAEHLVCAELSRLGLIATTFAHNVPTFDVLATDENCKPVPIQVKASTSNWWRSTASKWMDIVQNESEKTQHISGYRQLRTPDLIWVCVSVASKRGEKDRFFIFKESDLQKVLFMNYTNELKQVLGKRKKNWQADDCWWEIDDIIKYEDNWNLIEDQFKPKSVAQK